jgi:hypothetical protein
MPGLPLGEADGVSVACGEPLGVAEVGLPDVPSASGLGRDVATLGAPLAGPRVALGDRRAPAVVTATAVGAGDGSGAWDGDAACMSPGRPGSRPRPFPDSPTANTAPAVVTRTVVAPPSSANTRRRRPDWSKKTGSWRGRSLVMVLLPWFTVRPRSSGLRVMPRR